MQTIKLHVHVQVGYATAYKPTSKLLGYAPGICTELLHMCMYNENAGTCCWPAGRLLVNNGMCV